MLKVCVGFRFSGDLLFFSLNTIGLTQSIKKKNYIYYLVFVLYFFYFCCRMVIPVGVYDSSAQVIKFVCSIAYSPQCLKHIVESKCVEACHSSVILSNGKKRKRRRQRRRMKKKNTHNTQNKTIEIGKSSSKKLKQTC